MNACARTAFFFLYKAIAVRVRDDNDYNMYVTMVTATM